MTAPSAPLAGSASLTPSLVRTAVPILVGFLVSLAARHGLSIDNDNAASLLTALGAAVYYGVIRLVETRWPQAGVLLGVAKQPVYPSPVAPVAPFETKGNVL